MCKNSSAYTFAIWLSNILLVIVICLAVISPICSSVKSCKRNSSSSEASMKKIDNPYFRDLDDQLQKNKNQQKANSLIIEELWKNQKYLYSERENILADVRQETNNSIEKITSELNFWVAILAFLGVLVPIAITHKGEKEARIWLEKKESIYDEKIRNSMVSINLKMKEWSDQKTKMLEDLSSWQNKTNKDFQKQEKEQKSLIEELKLQRDVEMMTSIRNNRFIETDNELRKAYAENARLLIGKFLIYLDNQTKDYNKTPASDQKYKLMLMSTLFFDVINNLKMSHTEPSRPRILYQAEDAIKKYIKELLEVSPDSSILEQRYSEISKYIKALLNRM